jgi:hypothetical protein
MISCVDMEFDVLDIMIIITTTSTTITTTTTTTTISTKVRYWTLSEAASKQFTYLHAASVRPYLTQSPNHATVISLQDFLQQTVGINAGHVEK